MADGARTSILGLSVSLPTVIQIVSFAAVIYAQWTVLGREVDDIADDAKAMTVRADALNIRLYAVERSQGELAIRIEQLRETLADLRRQSFRSPSKPFP